MAESFRNPELGETVTSDFTVVHQFEPDVLEPIAKYRSNEAWGMCDAFMATDSGLLVPGRDDLRYHRLQQWEDLPGWSLLSEVKFQTAYAEVRSRIIRDAMTLFGTSAIAALVQIKHSGPEPAPLDDYERAAHLDFVGQLGQRVVVYHVSTKAPTVFSTGEYPYAGFLDDYATLPEFVNLTPKQPNNNALIRTEGITGIHAPDTQQPANRIHLRALVEPVG